MRFRLNALGCRPVDNAQDAAALFRLGHDHFNRVCRCAKNIDHFGNGLNAAQHVYGEAVSKRHNKNMPGRQGLRVLNGILFEAFIVSVKTNQALARRFVEGDAELHVRRRIDNRLIDIFHGFDEMALPDNDVSILRNRQSNRF